MGRRSSPKGAPLARIALKTSAKRKIEAIEERKEQGEAHHSGATPESEIADIITFIESEWGLGLPLFPVQRVILKAHYGIPLDDTETFLVTDYTREQRTWVTEAGYLRMLYNQGRCNIKEVTPGQELRKLILSVGRRSGKCVVGKTLVLTDRGLVRIENLGDSDGPEVQPLDVVVAQEGSKRSRSTKFYNGGVRETVKVETRCGYSIEGTPNHRIRVMGEDGKVRWRYLEDLQEGDYVAIHRGTNLWSEEYVDCLPYASDRGYKEVNFPRIFDEQWGLMLGYLVGDGSWTVSNSVQITVEHHETWEKLFSLMEEVFGERPRKCMDSRTENTGSLRIYSASWRDFLHHLGWSRDCDRRGKRIPWVILRSPEPVVRAFLRGLFETDGGVEKSGKVVSFSTASRVLAEEVQILLANLGIIARKKAKWNKEHERDYYLLTVRGLRSRRVFAEKVGFDSQKKMGPLLAILEEASREGGDAESIPHQRPWCRSLLESVKIAKDGEGWSRSKVRQALSNTIKPSAKDKLTYPRACEVIPVARETGADEDILRHFEEVIEKDYFYDPIVSIKEGKERVYDLVVPDGVSFVANAMTNHNTFLSSCIVAYEVYRLIHKYNPQKYYGIIQTNQINLVSIATSKDQSGLLFREAAGHFARCNFFNRFKANDTQSYINFQSPYEIERFGAYADNPKAKSGIRVSFAPCNAKGLRGYGNIVIIFDEIAHFVEQGGRSAEKVFEAVAPAAAAFSPKDASGNGIHGDDTPSDARIIMISSPLNRAGLFYKQFRKGMGDEGAKAAEGMLCIQAPTWEVNPKVPASVFIDFYTQDANQFFTEFGAEFTDRLLGFFDDEDDVYACIDKSLRPKKIGVPGRQYFLGFDLGLVNDSSALAITHIEGDRIVLDYIGEIKAGVGKYRDRKRLEFDDVADWIEGFCRLFAIHSGMFDQWSAIPLEQALEKKGLNQIKSEHMTAQKNSEIYQNFKSMIFDQKVVLYDLNEHDREALRRAQEPVPDHAPYITQLLELQAEYKSKYVIDVRAPKVAGKHDDLADALARAVWLASMNMGKARYIAGAVRGPQGPEGGYKPNYKEKARRRAQAKLGGSDPLRMKPGKNRRLHSWYVKRYPTR